jgi:hypothetical protein
MGNKEIKILKRTFDYQLQTSDIIYKDVFDKKGTLQDELFQEYSILEREPDLSVYMEARLRKEGFLTGELDMDFRDQNEMEIKRIFQEFKLEEADGLIPAVHYRPQLVQTGTFKKLKEVSIWRDELIDALIIQDRDTIKDEIINFISRIKQIFGGLSQSLSYQIAQKIHDDDFSDRIETLMYLKGTQANNDNGDTEVESILKGRPGHDIELRNEVNQKLSNWRYVRVSLQAELKAIIPQQKDKKNYL